MLKMLHIMLCCTAQKFYLLCSNRTVSCVKVVGCSIRVYRSFFCDIYFDYVASHGMAQI